MPTTLMPSPDQRPAHPLHPQISVDVAALVFGSGAVVFAAVALALVSRRLLRCCKKKRQVNYSRLTQMVPREYDNPFARLNRPKDTAEAVPEDDDDDDDLDDEYGVVAR